MDQRKILEYASYGALTKANEYDKKASKTTSAIKSKYFEDLAEIFRSDYKEIKNMRKDRG